MAKKRRTPKGNTHDQAQPPSLSSLTSEDYLTQIFTLLQDRHKLDFTHYRESTVIRRLQKRMAVNQIDTWEGYVTYLQRTPEEIRKLGEELLINVTGFFRDPEAFAQLEREVLPAVLRASSGEETVRIWVPGCATGEEAYSLAILVQEHLERLHKSAPVKIFATDIDPGAIARAAQGVFPESITTDITKQRLRHFFSHDGTTYRIARQLREMIFFAPHNLIKDPPFTKIDLISCRNLLIYFEPVLQKRVLSILHFALNRHGFLFLGPSETIGELSEEFRTIDKQWKLYQRQGHTRLPVPLKLPPEQRVTHSGPGRSDLGRTAREDPTLVRAYQALAHTLLPPCLLLNSRYELLYTFGNAPEFLTLQGEFTSDVARLVPHDLSISLAAALRRASETKKEVRYTDIRLHTSTGERQLNLRVQPVPDQSADDTFYVVFFEEAPPSPLPPSGQIESYNAASQTMQRIHDLEADLQLTKENLQASIEELEASNEELQSTNEELESANEELQSANEELQSVNQELYTVNTEYQNKIAELTELNNDIDNLLHSTDIGTLFLDPDLRIRKFTPAITGIMNLLPHDVGRPVEHISSTLEYNGLLGSTRQVLETGTPFEAEVRNHKGTWFLIRILPYRTGGSVRAGVVLTVTDISQIRQAEEALQEARAYAESIVATVREPLVVLNDASQVVTANRAFYQTFQVAPEETENKSIYELGGRQWDIPQLRQLLNNVLPQNTYFDNFEVTHEFSTIGLKTMLLNARRVQQEASRPPFILLAIEDITEQKRAAETLRVAQGQLREQQQRETEQVEAELERTRHQLIQQTRLATIGQVSASIAHELRNPLGAIRNAAYLLKRYLPAAEPKLAKNLDIVEEEVNSADRIISNLMEMSRGKEPTKQAVNLASLVQETYSQANSPQGIHFHCSFEPDPFVVWGDAAQLQQVFGNLFLNAIQAIDGHGALTVTANRFPEYDTITIQDTGSGVDPEHREQLFEPLFTTKAKGTGLGLAICRQIVERHGGTIELVNNGDDGAAFCVRLPRQRAT